MNRRFFFAAAGSMAVAALGSRVLADPLGMPIGLQLYTLGDELQKDFEGTLQKVASIGIRDVELTKFPGRKPVDIARALRTVGLRAVSTHVAADVLASDTQRELDEANVLGVKYLVSPTPGRRSPVQTEMGLDDWRWSADLFNRLGEQAKKAGIRFGYHNHGADFTRYDGIVAYDELLKRTDPKLVTMELDCGWVENCGVSAAQYLRNHPGRFQLLHIKDIKKRAPPDTPNTMLSTEVGHGIVDWKAIFAASKRGGVRHYFIEQEGPFEHPPLESVRLSYNWLHTRA